MVHATQITASECILLRTELNQHNSINVDLFYNVNLAVKNSNATGPILSTSLLFFS